MSRRGLLLFLIPIALSGIVPAPAAAQAIQPRIPLRLDADAARFSETDSLTYVEVFYGVSEACLTYGPAAGGYRGALEMSLRVEDSSGTVASRGWVLPRVIADGGDLGRPRNILSFESLAVPPGTYGLVLVCRDSVNRTRADSVRISLKIGRSPGRGPRFSDIELCSRISASGDRGSPFYRNTLEVVPNPSRLYGEGLPVVHFYAEVYDLDTGGRSDLRLRAVIADASGREVASQEKPKQRTHASSAEYGSMNIASLPGGSYTLKVSLVDTAAQGGPLAAVEKRFFVYNPRVAADTSLTPAGARDRAFAFLTETEADDEIRKVRYLATEPERKKIDQLPDLTARRNYLRDFWASRESGAAAADPVPGGRDGYFARVREADALYGERNRAGWLTDRGRVSILYGPPGDVERHPSTAETHPYEIWEYPEIQGGVIFVFVDRMGFGSYRLVHSTHLRELRNEDWYQLEAAVR